MSPLLSSDHETDLSLSLLMLMRSDTVGMLGWALSLPHPSWMRETRLYECDHYFSDTINLIAPHIAMPPCVTSPEFTLGPSGTPYFRMQWVMATWPNSCLRMFHTLAHLLVPLALGSPPPRPIGTADVRMYWVVSTCILQ